MGSEPRAELARMRTQLNAANEAEEAARRQDRQDAKKSSSGPLGKKQKIKERRTVYVNLENGATNPDSYERNKVRTSKYTLISFLPKVHPSPSLQESC